MDRIEAIDRWKTGAILSAACRLGGIAVGAPSDSLEALTIYGRSLGVAYQATDDLLDIESTPEVLGKTTGKDAQQGKLTYPAALGMDGARELAADKAAEAKAALKGFGKEALFLRLLADYVLTRKK